MDALVSQIPLDPFITLGLITFTCGGIGWLTGPIVGTGVFNLRNRKFKAQMDEKEKEFYRRIKRFRVDPSASSMANPVPGMLFTFLSGREKKACLLIMRRLLRREDLKCSRLSTMAEGPTGVQQETDDVYQLLD
jgi:hypothetical protein